MLFELIKSYYITINHFPNLHQIPLLELFNIKTKIHMYKSSNYLTDKHISKYWTIPLHLQSRISLVGCKGIILALSVLCEAEAGPITRDGVMRHAPHYPTGNNSIMKPVLSWRCNKLGWLNLGSTTVWPQQTGWSWCLSINFNGISEREMSCRRHWISQHVIIVDKIPKIPSPPKKTMCHLLHITFHV